MTLTLSSSSSVPASSDYLQFPHHAFVIPSEFSKKFAIAHTSGDFIHFSLHQRKRQVDSFLRLVFDNVLSTMNENEKYSESIIDFSLQESCIKSFIFRIGASLLDMQLK